MSGQPLLYVFLVAWVQTEVSSLNEYTQYIDPQGQYIWQSTSDFVPTPSQAFGSTIIGHQMSIEFDFIWTGHNQPSRGPAMMFRIGADAETGGSGCSGNWNRYPALFMTDEATPSLLLYLSETDECSKSYDLSAFGGISKGTPQHVAITFNMTAVHVVIVPKGLIPRSRRWTRSGTPSEFIGRTVPIWWISNQHGSNDYVPANATFSNITIKSKVTDSAFQISPNSPSTDVMMEDHGQIILVMVTAMCLLICAVAVICIGALLLHRARMKAEVFAANLQRSAPTEYRPRPRSPSSPSTINIICTTEPPPTDEGASPSEDEEVSLKKVASKTLDSEMLYHQPVVRVTVGNPREIVAPCTHQLSQVSLSGISKDLPLSPTPALEEVDESRSVATRPTPTSPTLFWRESDTVTNRISFKE